MKIMLHENLLIIVHQMTVQNNREFFAQQYVL